MLQHLYIEQLQYMHFQFDYLCSVTTYDIIHLLDSAEPDIRFVVRIEADESNISLDLHNKSNVWRGSAQQVFYYAEITK